MAEQSAQEIRHQIGSNGSLDLRNVSGRVRLAGTEGDEVIVICRSERGGEPRIHVERGRGSLLVEPERGRTGFLGFSLDRGIEFDVQLPRAARLDVKTVSADIDAHGLVGEQSYKTVSADLRLTGGSGRISFISVSGDVRLHEAGVIEVDGATTSGDVTVEAAKIPRLGLRTVSGDVRVAGHLAAGPRHSVETVSGDLSIEVAAGGLTLESRRALDLGRGDRRPLVYGDGQASLFFQSMSGDHRVTLGGGEGDATQAGSNARPGKPSPANTSPAPPAGEARLEILRALERGEIDVEEATRRLEGITNA
jgi:hypothetical protein